MKPPKESDVNEFVRRLKHEIDKRDSVISNLREANERLERALYKMIKVLAETAEENLDHQIIHEDP